MSVWERARYWGANCCIVGVLVPAIAAVVVGEENFPFTAAVMFCRDAGPDRPRYTMHWFARDATGEREVSPRDELTLSERHFFLHFWGPSEEDPPYPDTPRDPTWQAFAERAERWFRVFAERYERHFGQPLEGARLVLRRIHPAPARDYPVGNYDPHSGHFGRAEEP